MDTCFWERLGELHFSVMKMKDVGCIKDKINDTNPKRDELVNFRVYSIYSCHRDVHKGCVSTHRIIWLRWRKSSQESTQLIQSFMSLPWQFEITKKLWYVHDSLQTAILSSWDLHTVCYSPESLLSFSFFTSLRFLSLMLVLSFLALFTTYLAPDLWMFSSSASLKLLS